MSRTLSGTAARTLTLTEELERLEQSITLTLQEIDANFSKAHRIVTTSILPVVEQYGEHTLNVWEASKFWKQFFEASANCSLSNYEEAVSSRDGDGDGDGDESTLQRTTLEDESVLADDGDGDLTAGDSHDDDNSASCDDDDEKVHGSERRKATPRAKKHNSGPHEATATARSMRSQIATFGSPYEELRQELQGTRDKKTTATTADHANEEEDEEDEDEDEDEEDGEGAKEKEQDEDFEIDFSIGSDFSPVVHTAAARQAAEKPNNKDKGKAKGKRMSFDSDFDSDAEESALLAEHTRRLPDMSMTPRAPATVLRLAQLQDATAARERAKDPLLHRMGDKTFRIQATPLADRQRKLQWQRRPLQPDATTAAKSHDVDDDYEEHDFSVELDPESSPDLAAPTLRSAAFMSPTKVRGELADI